ncbi:MAG: DUF1329 domain-containing protein [Myxococcales bacterium]|nr:DUF1329 domain-containing protein [Myxococcales bacterium]
MGIGWLGVLAVVLCGARVAGAQADDAGSDSQVFDEGEVITFDDVRRLRPYLPEEFWDNRDFFFYEGMNLEIGPTQADYSAAREYAAATERYRGQPRIGPDGSLENYKAGQPFPMDEIDCAGDPQAGVKVMWDHKYQWRGSGGQPASFFYSYWDRGEQLPLYYEGTASGVQLSRRVEKQFEKTDGDVFRGEKRTGAGGAQVDAPFDARGIMLLTFRYKSSERPRAEAKNDDTWVYVPTLRRVRRISTAQRTDAVAGTDFTLDDLFSFNGVVPQYEWECLEETLAIAPMNTKVKAYPYEREHNFGPYGLSYADDRWELRDTFVMKMVPKNDDHPYRYKIIYLDKQTLTAHYSFAYDRKEELWKIITHNKRWSEDHRLTGEYYLPWEGIESVRDHHIVSDMIINVQTGTGNRIEFWDRTGMPFKSKGKIRRFIDVGRLTKGR